MSPVDRIKSVRRHVNVVVHRFRKMTIGPNVKKTLQLLMLLSMINASERKSWLGFDKTIA